MAEPTLFGTDGIRGIANQYPMTPELVQQLGRALGAYLRGTCTNGSTPHILVGMDTRQSCALLEAALSSGLTAEGVNVWRAGVLPTPAVAYLTPHYGAQAGVMISASHNPADDNGIKIFDHEGYKYTPAQEVYLESMLSDTRASDNGIYGGEVGSISSLEDAQERYIEFLKHSADNVSLEGFRIAMDCANGAASYAGPRVFRELGAEVVLIHNEPDGTNINDGCGALYPQKVSDLVRGHYADMGLALDGDADRVVFVDEKGSIVDGDAIIWLIASLLKKQGGLAHDTVVATDYSNCALDAYLQARECELVRVPCGDRNVLEAMRAHGYSFGGEQSGHLIFGDYTSTGDGLMSALRLLRLLQDEGTSLSELARHFEPYPQCLKNQKVTQKIPLEDLPRTNEVISRVESSLGEHGRVFVRYSGTENKVRVLVEAPSDPGLEQYAQEVLESIVHETAELPYQKRS